MKVNNYTSNPEINRNIWLELSMNRLVIIPLIISLTLGLLFLTAVKFFNMEASGVVNTTSKYFLYFFAFIVGTRQSASAIIKEVHAKTWDSQRLLTISPWSMTIGKVFGSTIYGWYGVLWGAVLYVFSSLNLDHSFERVLFLFTVLLCIVLVHALIISLTVLKIDKNREATTISTFFYFVIGLVVAVLLVVYAETMLDFNDQDMFWYTLTLPKIPFVFGSVLFFTGWALFGLYRTMRKEYQFKNTIIPWALFVSCGMTFFGGVYSADHISSLSKGLVNFDQIAVSTHTAFIIGIALMYYLAFSESRGIVNMRNLKRAVQERNVQKLLVISPLWLVTALIVIVPCMLSVLFSFGVVSLEDTSLMINSFWALNIFAFCVRDIALLHFMSFVNSKKSTEVIVVVYLMVLYGIVPSLLYSMNLSMLVPVFLPVFESGLIVGTIAPLIFTGLSVYLVMRELKKYNG